MKGQILVIACGAIARELVQISKLNGWDQMTFQCLPAELHNTPEKIPGAVRKVIDDQGDEFDQVFVAYADCGTGGLLDKALEGLDIGRIAGAHCYEFYAGTDAFSRLSEEAPGTFYLTDFLVHSFDRLVRQGLGLDRFPQLREQYFGNYSRVVYLAQNHSARLVEMAREQATFLGLDYEYRHTGLTPLDDALKIELLED